MNNNVISLLSSLDKRICISRHWIATGRLSINSDNIRRKRNRRTRPRWSRFWWNDDQSSYSYDRIRFVNNIAHCLVFTSLGIISGSRSTFGSSLDNGIAKRSRRWWRKLRSSCSFICLLWSLVPFYLSHFGHDGGPLCLFAHTSSSLVKLIIQ